MIHTTKGLIGVLNKNSITITSKNIIKWSLEDASIIQTLNHTFEENLYNYDVKEKDGRLFITDLQTSDLYCLEDDFNIKTIVFEDRYEDRKLRTNYLFKNLNFEDLIINTRDSYGYYLLNLKNYQLTKYLSILVSKYMRPFSIMDSDTLFISYNILYSANDSEEILYHYHYDGTKSEIGIYITAEEKKIIQFEAPEPIACINFFTNLTNEYNTKTYSNVKGCLIRDKIVLCYQHMLYVLDYDGKVLKTRPVKENSRYWGLEKLNEHQVLVAELDPEDPEKMFVFEYDIL
ncbi:hypothetical protein [Chryseobacterium cheonjiense]|uniref:Uncharacterized protein n=1 Tax=Chryseobacterium cheonjiense TaxID=2728845 RepID=A0A7Y0A6P0_9FLAO|nr:hypothetical protein [Chryseobacterium cheonjiense]NML57697.1 hypothetical protein [Chryseobacterium cheonjiense]